MEENKAPFPILNKGNLIFCELLLTLDIVTSSLHRQGIGTTKYSALVISFEHEDLMWEKQLLGYHTPKALQRAVFFYVALSFVLRGQQEPHDLKPQQLTCYPSDSSVYSEDVFYEYTEFALKNNQPMLRLGLTGALFGFLTCTSASYLQTHQHFTSEHLIKHLWILRNPDIAEVVLE